jgi:hypothetical protein
MEADVNAQIYLLFFPEELKNKMSRKETTQHTCQIAAAIALLDKDSPNW